ncbi:MAG: TaqI family restriction endonuclease [Armatimonadetes bacterium]|nr:TaqI family restriction endonuclease [Armatimonadota bacterium]
MDARGMLERFEAFLETIPLEHYRKELVPVKTVEQDLPKDLNPLPAIYTNYWRSQTAEFPNYEEFFRKWWTEHLKPLDAFIRKYFWGCSYEFVYLGFKARIYRTLISVLTQFHFAYSWLAYCQLPLEASAELDMQGIDALVTAGEIKVAFQVKKETYRSEARESGRFARRKLQFQFAVEVPYTITRPEEWKQKATRARNDQTKEQARLFALLAERFQRWLPNGFVVFQANYPRLMERLVKEVIVQGSQDIVNWHEVLNWLKHQTV